MARALSLSCLPLLLIGSLAVPAQAGGKASVCVLGLEVNDPNGAPTPTDTAVARDLTDGLRGRAKLGNGPYQIQPGSEKELIDEKLLKNCTDEGLGCMSQIGNELGCDVLIYGSIVKKSSAYDVTLTLLDVRNRQKKAAPVTIPTNQTGSPAIQQWAKQLYNRLTGQADTGQVVLKLNNGDLRGTFKIDGDEKGSINSGSGTASGISPGKHTVTVVVPRYRTRDIPITVAEGQTTTIPVDNLEREDEGTSAAPGIIDNNGHPPIDTGGGEVHRGDGTWRGLFVTTVVVGLSGVGVLLYGRSQIGDAQDALCRDGGYKATLAQHPGCAAPPTVSNSVIDSENDKGHTGRTMTVVGTVVGLAAIPFFGITLYKGFIAREKTNTEHAGNGHRVHRDSFIVTPVISPNGGGATLQFDW